MFTCLNLICYSSQACSMVFRLCFVTTFSTMPSRKRPRPDPAPLQPSAWLSKPSATGRGSQPADLTKSKGAELPSAKPALQNQKQIIFHGGSALPSSTSTLEGKAFDPSPGPYSAQASALPISEGDDAKPAPALQRTASPTTSAPSSTSPAKQALGHMFRANAVEDPASILTTQDAHNTWTNSVDPRYRRWPPRIGK